MLSEISQTEEKYYMISLICGVEKTKQNRSRLSDTENKLVVVGGEGDERMDEIGEGD